MPPSTETVEEAPETPPTTTMSNWMSGIADIGKMVDNQPPAPGAIAGVGEVGKKKEAEDGKTGSESAGAVASPGAAKPSGDSATAKPEAAAAGADGKHSETDVGEEKWPRNAKDWDTFKEKRKKSEDTLKAHIAERETKIKALETQLAESAKTTGDQPDPGIKAELDRQIALNKQLTEKIMVLDVTNDPRFISYFENKTKAQVDLAKRIVGPDKADQLAKILAMPDSEYKNSQIEEFTSDLSGMQQSRFGGVLNALEEIEQERQAEIAKASDLKGRMTAEQIQKAENNGKLREKWFNDTLGAVVANKEIDLFRPKDGDDVWNTALTQRITKAKELFLGKAKPEEIAGAALFAASMPVLITRYKDDIKSRDDKITKLEAQIKTLTAAQPAGDKGVGAGGPGADKAEGETLKEGMTPHEAGSAFIKSMHSMLKQQ